MVKKTNPKTKKKIVKKIVKKSAKKPVNKPNKLNVYSNLSKQPKSAKRKLKKLKIANTLLPCQNIPTKG